ncbi:hypothetical protein AK812_SmicGene48580, partial [Symbiodinium microadriaticum]
RPWRRAAQKPGRGRRRREKIHRRRPRRHPRE